MYNPASHNALATNQYGHIQAQHNSPFQNPAPFSEFNGFHGNRHHQVPNRHHQVPSYAIENGLRIEENGFSGFHTNSSTSRNHQTPRNEPDNRGHQPQSTTLALSNSALQEQYGISQSKPKHPQYAIKTVRVSSFRDFPPGITQTPEDMAQAGFFYSGKEDVVFCFFCGQGLKAWEPEDDVWIEHARWSPNCVHLLNCKGREFVRMVQLAETNPENPLPSSQNGTDHTDLSLPLTRQAATNHTNGASGNPKDGAVSRTLETCNSPLLQTVAAQSVITNGYNRDAVLKAINVFKLKEGRSNFNATDLLMTIFDLEDGSINYDALVADIIPNHHAASEMQPQVAEQSPKKHETSDVTEADQREAKSLLAENRHLKDQTLCKICLEEIVSIVFLPCGHLCCCSQCAPALRKCPICRGFIKGTVKTYLT